MKKGILRSVRFKPLLTAAVLLASQMPGAAQGQPVPVERTSTPAGIQPEAFDPAWVAEDYDAGAQPVTLTVPAFGEENSGPVQLGWNPAWFAEADTFRYHHGIARIACALAGIAYSEEFVGQAYAALGFDGASVEMHYDMDYDDETWGVDQTSFSFARRSVPGTDIPLVAVAIRGTPITQEEWFSNVNIAGASGAQEAVSVPDEHEGFARATEQVYLALQAYLAAHGIATRSARFLLCGHSRGAAVGNLLAVRLLDAGVQAGHIFAYTFAAPNVTRDPAVSDARYSFIWNIVNQEDLVPTIPFESGSWGYRKYGHTLAFINYFTCPDADTYKEAYLPAVNAVFSAILKREYYPFYTGNFFPYMFSVVGQYFSPDVKSFYSGGTVSHSPLVSALKKILPQTVRGEEPTLAEVAQNSTGGTVGIILGMVERQYPGSIDYLKYAATDMHRDETYLSWLAALEPEQLFTATDCHILRCSGHSDLRITDEAGRLYASAENGVPDNAYMLKGYPALRLPSGTMYIAVPGNRPLTVTISNDSVFASPSGFTVETFSPSGSLRRTDSYRTLFVRWTKIYTLELNGVRQAELLGSGGTNAIRTSWRNAAHSFTVKPEFFADTERNLGIGVQAGFPHIYSLFEAKTNTWCGYDSVTVSAGMGAQTNLSDAFFGSLNAQWQFVFDTKDRSEILNQVLYTGAMLAYQPRRRFQLFAALGAEYSAGSWNAHAFNADMRRHTEPFFSVGKTGVYPQLKFGLLF